MDGDATHRPTLFAFLSVGDETVPGTFHDSQVQPHGWGIAINAAFQLLPTMIPKAFAASAEVSPESGELPPRMRSTESSKKHFGIVPVATGRGPGDSHRIGGLLALFVVCQTTNR